MRSWNAEDHHHTRSDLARPDAIAPDHPTTHGGVARTQGLRGQILVAPHQPAVGVIHVRLDGELDVLSVPRSRRLVTAAINAVACEAVRSHRAGRRWSGRVVLDLDRLDFLAVRGAGMLADLVQHAGERDVELVLVASCRPVRRVLELVKLDALVASVVTDDPTGVVGSGAVPRPTTRCHA